MIRMLIYEGQPTNHEGTFPVTCGVVGLSYGILVDLSITYT